MDINKEIALKIEKSLFTHKFIDNIISNVRVELIKPFFSFDPVEKFLGPDGVISATHKMQALWAFKKKLVEVKESGKTVDLDFTSEVVEVTDTLGEILLNVNVNGENFDIGTLTMTVDESDKTIEVKVQSDTITLTLKRPLYEAVL